jgi:hypothetical protein
MAKPSSDNPRAKPGFVLSRKAVAGWVVVVFIISGWMFGMGVMVGRDTAPIRFDLDQLKKTLESLQKSEREPRRGAPAADPAQMKDKTKLDFYEVLSTSRDDVDMPKLPKPAAARPEPEPQLPKPRSRRPRSRRRSPPLLRPPALRRPARFSPSRSPRSKARRRPAA